MLLRLVALAILTAVVMGTSGCSGNGGCTDIGCGSQVVFWTDADLQATVAYDVEACVDDVCESATLEVPEDRVAEGVVPSIEVGALGLETDRDVVYFGLPDGNWSGSHQFSLVIRDAAGTIVADITQTGRFERMQPNGPDCPPVCWMADIRE